MTVPYVNKFRPAEHALPRSWLAADYSDLIAQAETAADDPASAEEPAANFYPSPNPSPNPRPSPNPSPNPNPNLNPSPNPNPNPNPNQDPAATFYASLAAALRPHVVLVRKVPRRHGTRAAHARALESRRACNASLGHGVVRRASHGR